MVSQEPSQIKVTIGKNIRSARDTQGLSQMDLAVALECHSMLVSKWERGLHSPSDHNLQRLSSVLGESVAWFYTDHSREPNGDETPVAA